MTNAVNIHEAKTRLLDIIGNYISNQEWKSPMGRYEKLLTQILRGNSDANILFSDLLNFLTHFGFEMRVKGSHHIFRKKGVEERPNLQKEGIKAKPYQVKQVRHLILKYKLGDEE